MHQKAEGSTFKIRIGPDNFDDNLPLRKKWLLAKFAPKPEEIVLTEQELALISQQPVFGLNYDKK